MGYCTWTYIRIDKLNEEQVKRCIEKAIWNSKHTTYGKYSNIPEEQYIKKWISFHLKEYDYFAKELGTPTFEMTPEYLTENIKKRMKQWFYNQECYQKVLNGEMKFDEMFFETNQYLNDTLCDFHFIKRDNHYYVNIDYEIFRNNEYVENDFNTVESLIEHLEKPESKHIYDLDDNMKTNVQYEYGPLSEPLKKKIIDYYKAIGDYNFVVHFG